jgi:tRNA(adenine34) deaminase
MTPPPRSTATDEATIRACIGLAVEAAAAGNPPFGAVLFDAAGHEVARVHNTQVSSNDPTAHAEINALRAGGAHARSPLLTGWRLYVNAEPCSMCLSAIVKAQVGELVFGAPHESHLDPYLPAIDVLAQTKRPPRVTGGVLAHEAARQIQAAREDTVEVD